jgi:hypothetical protein
MTWIAAAVSFLGPTGTALLGGAGLSYLGSRNQASAATSAADLQAQAAQRAADQQMQMFTTLNEQQKPYREAGYGALNQINTMLPQFTKTFGAADLNANLAPNYEFMRQQGLGATAQAANVASPGSNVDLAKTIFAEKYAQSGYQDALNNYRNQQTDIFNRLSGIAGIGQTAQGSAQALGSQTAANLGQLGIGGASALGAGQINAANAMAGGAGNIGNAGFLYSMLKKPNAGTSDVSGSWDPVTGTFKV